MVSSSAPGRVLLSADNSRDRLLGDGPAMLASVFPGRAYDGLLASQLEPMPETYYRRYMQTGVFSLIFGPTRIPEPASPVPTFDVLTNTGHTTSFRHDDAGRSLRLHVSGCRAEPSHTHFDQGSLVVECDAKPILIDRGIVRYDDARGPAMKRSEMHKVLPPRLESGVCPDQSLPRETAIVPDATGDTERFTASVDLSAAWPEPPASYSRRVVSESIDAWTLHETGRWTRPLAAVQHFEALSRFVIEDDAVVLNHEGVTIRIEAPWATQRKQAEDGIDFAYRPVFHLTLEAPAAEDFDWSPPADWRTAVDLPMTGPAALDDFYVQGRAELVTPTDEGLRVQTPFARTPKPGGGTRPNTSRSTSISSTSGWSSSSRATSTSATSCSADQSGA